MGLDMYLTRNTYVKNWEFQDRKDKHEITVKKGGEIRKDIKPERISHIIEEVCYWRKANQIHKWFVDNVQEGKDDCEEYYVTKEKLQELVDLCKRVIANADSAKQLLPTASGFFFGSTSYGEYYIDDLKHTIKMIEPYLNDDGGTFYYHSSW
jgi:hypothetical protein